MLLSYHVRHIQTTSDYRFTVTPVRDMIIACSKMHRTDKHSQHSSIIWPVWLNGWVFVYELSGCGYESSCYHLRKTLFIILKNLNATIY